MTLDEIRQKKIELGYSNQQLADLSGVPLGTLQKILSGATKAPRRETILAIEKVLKKPHGEVTYQYNPDNTSSMMVCETPALYNTTPDKKLYTLEDYLALPDEQRVELIDGVFYDMAAPTTVHQAIGGFIYKTLLDHVLTHGGKCMPFMSPVDVQLDRDDKTVVQPDVLIVCDREKLQNGRVFGAPDFIVEVLSKSTRKKDMLLKVCKYGNADVREYWIIDPEKRCVVVYDLEHEEFPVIYNKDDKIPVRIWDNACEVDMGMIFDYISFLYD